jgi:hypothetical protein
MDDIQLSEDKIQDHPIRDAMSIPDKPCYGSIMFSNTPIVSTTMYLLQ